ncbi:MAG: DUF6157 family protein [Weeksellaceae bacterium]|nr:DUF6157 family protein [Weeksellaceae bacterium]
MKQHSTNYKNTLIEVAEDTRATESVEPPKKFPPSIAELQHQVISENPYRYSSDDVIFGIWANRNGVEEADMEEARVKFFSKGQPCLRTSPLAQTYGYGIHSDGDGKVAVYGMETKEYRALQDDPSITKVQAMRSKRA